MTEPASGTASRVARWLLTIATVGLLALFARRIDWHATAAALRRTSFPLLALATVVNIASVLVKGGRWWLFLRPAGARGMGLPLRATLAGAGLNNVLVANGGDVARVVFVTRTLAIPSATVLATLALERTWDLIGYAVLLAVSATILPLPAELARWRTAAVAALAVVLVGLWLLVRSARSPDIARAMAAAAAPGSAPAAPASPQRRVRAYFTRFGDSVRELSSAPRFAAALALSMLAWGLQIATYGVTAAAAHAPLSIAGNVTTVLVVNLGFAVRVTPGGVGIFQALYTLGATRFGMPQPTAVAVALLIQTIQILPVTLLGVALAPEFIFRRGAQRSRG